MIRPDYSGLARTWYADPEIRKRLLYMVKTWRVVIRMFRVLLDSVTVAEQRYRSGL